MSENRVTEIFQGRAIEVSRVAAEDGTNGHPVWTGRYAGPNGQVLPEGFGYNSTEECLAWCRAAIKWETDFEKAKHQFKELFERFESQGLLKVAILDGLCELLDERGWNQEILRHLEAATGAAIPDKGLS